MPGAQRGRNHSQQRRLRERYLLPFKGPCSEQNSIALRVLLPDGWHTHAHTHAYAHTHRARTHTDAAIATLCYKRGSEGDGNIRRRAGRRTWSSADQYPESGGASPGGCRWPPADPPSPGVPPQCSPAGPAAVSSASPATPSLALGVSGVPVVPLPSTAVLGIQALTMMGILKYPSHTREENPGMNVLSINIVMMILRMAARGPVQLAASGTRGPPQGAPWKHRQKGCRAVS